MRVLILILAAGVVALAVSIVMHVDERSRRGTFSQRLGPRMKVGAMLADGKASEEAEYSETTSFRRMHYRIEQAPHLPPFAVPWKMIRRTLRDARNRTYENAATGVGYRHNLSTHGWFPLMAPEAPDALDRVWVIRSIRQDKITVSRAEWDCWRVDLIDPALPAGRDTVVAWLNEKIPVFGLLKWKRAGETWEFVKGKRAR